MRRFENGTRDPKIIKAILDEIDIVHVGCFDEEYPYVVPLSFGYEITEDKLLVYLHGAREGHKVDLWEKNPHVALTFSKFLNYPDRPYRGSIHDYRSVMALGTISKVDRHTLGHGTAVQSVLKHNNRKPSQFSVPHYMWMGVYVVTCNLEDVVAKMENPVTDPAEIPFADVYNSPENLEPFDPEYFYHRKQYKRFSTNSGKAWTEFESQLPILSDVDCLTLVADSRNDSALDNEKTISGNEFDLLFRWKLRDGIQDADLDISALILNEDGTVPRRYDMAFYNQASDRSHTVIHAGDDTLGNEFGREALHLSLGSAPDYISSIICNLSIFQADHTIAELLEFIQLNVVCSESGAVLGEYSIDASDMTSPAASLVRIDRNADGAGEWMLKKEEHSYSSWRILDQAAEHGLVNWNE